MTRLRLGPVLDAALATFAAKGYHGTSIRDLAASAGLSVAGVYHHYASKQQILQALLDAVMHDLLARTEAALASAPADPAGRLEALMETLVRYHLDSQRAAFVAATEIRSLEPEARESYIGLRDRQQRMIDEVVESGCATGAFTTPEPHEAARALAVLCVGVAHWYRADGPASPDEVVRRQLVLARAVVGA